ncbi:MAG: hypothetical protein SFV54_03810 [Bryobacteraceae bacterium]|nr:hypothetical protein [Bryobacteraceae bacterium]
MYVVAYVAVFGIVVPFRSPEGPVWHYGFYGFIFLTGLLAYFLLRRRNAQAHEALTFSLTTGGQTFAVASTADDKGAIREYLVGRAVILASLISRAAAEICMQRGVNSIDYPEGIMRQVQNGLLRQRRLWGRLERTETELMGASEGSWTEEQQNEVVVWCEQLRLLRWVLGVDAELMPLAHFPAIDFKLANDISRLYGSEEPHRPMMNSWDVRMDRDTALEYAARLVSELKARKLIADSPELEGWAGHLREISPGASTDYVVGAKTVEQLTNEELMYFAVVTAARERYATYLVEQLSADSALSFSEWSLTLSGE